MRDGRYDPFRRRFSDRLRLDEPLAPHTSFRIGGNADALLSARSRADVADALALADTLALPCLVLGRGSNVLIDDAGFRGLVIRNESNVVTIDRDNGLVESDAGARLPTVGVQTAKAGLVGFEWAVGIPGSVGGAVVMNAGAHGGCLSDSLTTAEVFVAGNRETWNAARFDHSYRSSLLQRHRDVIVLGASLSLKLGDSREALGRIQEYRAHRQATQPTDPGAGSIFRNPPDRSSGE
ncbi:MAG TPA: FAD-binding protein, partial [Chloroflexota bacterium]|nr:FAD-binding protein [Chloroflexota bacterium]